MRRQYTINSKHCHFQISENGVFHDIHDLMQLVSIPAHAQDAVIDRWRDKLTSVKSRNEHGYENHLVIQESLVLDFLSSALKTHQGASITNAKNLFHRIINERLDAIVGNSSHHSLPKDPTARRQALEHSKKAFLSIKNLMNKFENEGGLTKDQIKQWKKIKTLLPDTRRSINERAFYALLVLIEPIWPSEPLPSAISAERALHFSLSIFIEIIRSDLMENTQKPIFLQKAFLRFDKYQKDKKSESPEP
ncbi:hypothetical protein ACK25U_12660 [Ectopseudomonas mendocina]